MQCLGVLYFIMSCSAIPAQDKWIKQKYAFNWQVHYFYILQINYMTKILYTYIFYTIGLTQNGDRYQAFVNAVMKLQVP
jgi:hypothetical protein